MMQIVQKWKVTVTFADHEIVLWINENHPANVLRKLADLQFTENGLEQPVSIMIKIVAGPSGT